MRDGPTHMGRIPIEHSRTFGYHHFVLTKMLYLRLPAAMLIVLAHAAGAAVSSSPPEPQPTRYMIVVTGGELLSGVYPDGHTYFITRTLHPLGLQCVGSMCVDDRQADIREAAQSFEG